jgi:tetratricopeptide (TPR) repeat protein
VRTSFVIALFVLLFPPVTAVADYGGPPPPAPSTGPPADSPRGDAPSVAAATGRVERAHQLYASGYDEVVKADMDLKRGKAKDAEKRWMRARERLREAVVLDTTHVEAWNLIGFTSRRLREYDESFAAYRTALRQKPLFALAREYYGQGLLESGDLEGAKQQLMWLKKIGDQEHIDSLGQSIAEYELEHGGAAGDSAGTGPR